MNMTPSIFRLTPEKPLEENLLSALVTESRFRKPFLSFPILVAPARPTTRSISIPDIRDFLLILPPYPCAVVKRRDDVQLFSRLLNLSVYTAATSLSPPGTVLYIFLVISYDPLSGP